LASRPELAEISTTHWREAEWIPAPIWTMYRHLLAWRGPARNLVTIPLLLLFSTLYIAFNFRRESLEDTQERNTILTDLKTCRNLHTELTFPLSSKYNAFDKD
jgi:hypothetical protein